MDVNRVKRGDIVFVNNLCREPHGFVLSGNHPAVVIQNNAGNMYSRNLIVAYMTSSLKRIELPTKVVLQWYGGLRNVSVVETEQLSTISKDDVISVIDRLRPEDMERVNKALMASLALGEEDEDGST